MKKMNLLGKLLIAGALIAPMGCADSLLDEKLYNQVETSDFLRNAEEVTAAMGAAYTRLYPLMNHGAYFSTQEVNSNECLIPQRGNDWFDGGQWINTHRHVQGGGEDCYNNAWTFLYGGVNTCNRLLKQVAEAQTAGNLDAATAASFLAELRGLRGLFYYWLLDSFGNVPIVDSYEVDPANLIGNEGANNRAKVYAFVEKELNEILPLLTDKVSSSTYGRFSKWSAQALLAHLYLNAEVYKGAAENQKAYDAASAVVASGLFQVNRNYKSNFGTVNEGSPETILAIPYDKVFAQGFNIPQMTLHYASQATYNLTAQPWNGWCVATDFYNSYENGDERKSNFLTGIQRAADGVTVLKDPSFDDPDGETLNFTPEINALEPNCQRQAGARIGKFEFQNGATPNLSNDMPILRYADVVLIKAEAKARLAGDWNNAETAGIVNNDIRANRGSLAPLNPVTAENFLAERGREMFYEGWRRSDLIRFGEFNTPRGMRLQEGKPASAAHTRLWPIPKSQINANPNLKQNTGY